jgi:chemotaxis protein MotA
MISMFTRLLGFCGMVTCLWVVYEFEGTSNAVGIMRLFHWPAMVLTGLGPVALVFLCFDASEVFRAFGMAMFRSPSNMKKKVYKEALFLHGLGKSFYDGGQRAFDSAKAPGLTAFVSKIVERLSLRMPVPDIRDLSMLDQGKRESELVSAVNVVSSAVRLTPSIGMLGTIMGMVRLLSTLEDPSQIGAHMGLALLTTFYGLFFSLALWTPVQQKIERLLSVEMQGFDQSLRWLELLEKRKPTSYFADTAEISDDKPKARRAA